jgi:hypothetical protein
MMMVLWLLLLMIITMLMEPEHKRGNVCTWESVGRERREYWGLNRIKAFYIYRCIKIA